MEGEIARFSIYNIFVTLVPPSVILGGLLYLISVKRALIQHML